MIFLHALGIVFVICCSSVVYTMPKKGEKFVSPQKSTSTKKAKQTKEQLKSKPKTRTRKEKQSELAAVQANLTSTTSSSPERTLTLPEQLEAIQDLSIKRKVATEHLVRVVISLIHLDQSRVQATLKLLLASGAEINSTINNYPGGPYLNGLSPLLIVILRRSLYFTQFLLEHQADILHTVNIPWAASALHAAFYDIPERPTNILAMVKLLVRHGAHVNARDSNKYTPLHLACDPRLLNMPNRDLSNCIRYLIGHGAQPDLVQMPEREKIFKAITDSFEQAALFGHVEFLRPLDKASYTKQNRALLYACVLGHETMVKALLEILMSTHTPADATVQIESALKRLKKLLEYQKKILPPAKQALYTALINLLTGYLTDAQTISIPDQELTTLEQTGFNDITLYLNLDNSLTSDSGNDNQEAHLFDALNMGQADNLCLALVDTSGNLI